MLARCTTATVFLTAVGVSADVVTYECMALPDDTSEGWIRSDRLHLADRWLETGWFVQYAEIADPGPPVVPEDDFYRYDLLDFAEEDTFFVEWRMETDGCREGIPDVAPAVLTASGRSGIFYHFTIAADQVRYIDSDLNVDLIDIGPGVPHTYRVELQPTEDLWFIDGELVLTASPAGPYPTSDSVIKFGARAACGSITARWDYVRFGSIPDPGGGDFDSDGHLDLQDFYFFHECLESNGPDTNAWPGCVFADMDEDGDVDLYDFALFDVAFTGTE